MIEAQSKVIFERFDKFHQGFLTVQDFLACCFDVIEGPHTLLSLSHRFFLVSRIRPFFDRSNPFARRSDLFLLFQRRLCYSLNACKRVCKSSSSLSASWGTATTLGVIVGRWSTLPKREDRCQADECVFRSLTAKDFIQDFLHFVVGFFFEIAVVHGSIHRFADHLTHDAHLNSILLSTAVPSKILPWPVRGRIPPRCLAVARLSSIRSANERCRHSSAWCPSDERCLTTEREFQTIESMLTTNSVDSSPRHRWCRDWRWPSTVDSCCVSVWRLLWPRFSARLCCCSRHVCECRRTTFEFLDRILQRDEKRVSRSKRAVLTSDLSI